ncbi:histone H2B 1/2 [Odocoileus virginianus]|uniref:Histone H2B 1/2 n=1 Tax=Odocoileus virginianus TaxID=9874 RepID=A0A6J0W744_ODOVR|nr:late histone H2B.L4 [Odocoileus virginianus texanus]
MAEPSSDNSEEGLLTEEPCSSLMEISEFSKPEPCDDEPRKEKKTAKGCRRRRRRRRHSCRMNNFASFATYFPRVLRQVHTGLSLSHETLNIMDSFVKDMFERIAEEAGRLTRSCKRCTIMSEDIQTAVRLLLPGEIGKYAMYEATKSVIRYNSRR